MTRVLVIEDEPSFIEALEIALTKEGFEVVTAADGKSGLNSFRNQQPDVVLLDLMLPGLPGFDVLKAIRRDSATPVIVVSAKDAEADVVSALELGADDYVTKPYSVRELVARIRTAARRTPGTPENIIRVAGVSLDIAGHLLEVDGEQIDLPKKEFEVLQLLIERPGKVVSRFEFIDTIWGFAWAGDTRTLDQHIRRLRRRLEQAAASPHIETVRGVGYRLRVPVADR